MARHDRTSSCSQLERLPRDPAIRTDLVNGVLGDFTPALMADRFRRQNNRTVVRLWIMVHVREAANLTIAHPRSFDISKRAPNSSADQVASVGENNIQPNLCIRVDLTNSVSKPPDHFAHDLECRMPRPTDLERSDQMKDMLAISLPEDQPSAFDRDLPEQRGPNLVEMRHRAVVSKDPTPVRKRMRVFKARRANRCPPNMRHHLFRVDPRRSALKMLTVIGCPRLPLHVRQIALESRHAPPVRVALAGPVSRALDHQRVLRMHQRAFDLGWLRRAKSVQAAHAAPSRRSLLLAVSVNPRRLGQ